MRIATRAETARNTRAVASHRSVRRTSLGSAEACGLPKKRRLASECNLVTCRRSADLSGEIGTRIEGLKSAQNGRFLSHLLDAVVCLVSQVRALASSGDSRLATRRNAIPICPYSFRRAWQVSHVPTCSASSGEMLSPS
jgi:hypothetical protein